MIKICIRYVFKSALFWAYLGLSLLLSLSSLAAPFLIGQIINLLTSGNSSVADALPLCLLLASLGIGSAVLSYMSEMMYIKTQSHAGFKLNADTISHVQRLPQAFFIHFDASFYNQQINHDSNDLIIFLISSCVQLVSNGCLLFAAMFILCALDIRMGLVCLGLSGLACAMYLLFRRVLFSTNLDAQNQTATFFSCLQDQLDRIAFIQQHALYGRFRQVLSRTFDDVYQTLLLRQRSESSFSLSNAIVSALCQGGIFLVGAYEIISGRLLAGYLITALSYYSTFNSSLQFFAAFGKDYQTARVCLERLQRIWEIPEEKNGEVILRDIHIIECRNLAYLYPGNNGPSFQRVNALFEQGKLYGIAGRNGAGKTTLLKVLSGLYPHDIQGCIRYDGVSLQNIDCTKMREHCFGMTEQEPPILQDTFFANATLLAENPDLKLLDSYIDLLGLREMIESSSAGIQTMLDGHQPNLSGGERQKLAIIRQLMKDPTVMLFDEPTSAMDAASKKKFIRLLEVKRLGHILIVVTHDSDLLEVCDEVIDLEPKR